MDLPTENEISFVENHHLEFSWQKKTTLKLTASLLVGCWTKNKGDFTPKMDGENNGSKPYEQMDDLGVPLFLETPHFNLLTHPHLAFKLHTKMPFLMISDPNIVVSLKHRQKRSEEKKNLVLIPIFSTVECLGTKKTSFDTYMDIKYFGEKFPIVTKPEFFRRLGVDSLSKPPSKGVTNRRTGSL